MVRKQCNGGKRIGSPTASTPELFSFLIPYTKQKKGKPFPWLRFLINTRGAAAQGDSYLVRADNR